MNLSLDEYRALVAKAFRGAQYPWGLTEEASFAARRLAEFGVPSGDMVVRLLTLLDGDKLRERMPNADWSSDGRVLCAICVGTALADQSGCETLRLEAVAEPALLAPFLQFTLREKSGSGYRISWDGGTCEVSVSSIYVSGDLPMGPVPTAVDRYDVAPSTSPAVRRVELDAGTMAHLERFAHRIYAPATNASRAGAGYGTPGIDSKD